MKAGRLGIIVALLASTAGAETTPPPGGDDRQAIEAGSAAERARELKLLGISQLQPTRSARDPSAPDVANFDESKANPYPKLPPLLVTSAGKPVTTAEQWWKVRRPEIQAMLDREIYGIMPAHIPGVTWRVTGTVRGAAGGIPVVTRKLVGHVDNRAAPAITVDILMNVTVPVSTVGHRIPAVMAFGAVNPRPRPAGFPAIAEPAGPGYAEQIARKGWALVTVDTASIQADNGAGLTRGIIGLVNKGQPRGLADWGVLKAWAWGASRALDYLETDPDIDAKQVAIFGHSRNGKAALVTLAYDRRFAIGYISSSGAGGAALYRRNYGEGIPNLEATSEFHWFAGRFLQYDEVGHTANELPVDSHFLIAMAAPRPLFISGGKLMLEPGVAPGDAWVDPRGMFMGAAAASPAWSLLGRKGLQTSEFPPLLTYLGDGDIGFRQHEYGHTPAPNWPYFIQFASKYLH